MISGVTDKAVQHHLMEHCDHLRGVGTLQHRLPVQGRRDKLVAAFQVITGRHDHRAPVLGVSNIAGTMIGCQYRSM